MEEKKVCKCCGRELPIEQFTKNGFGLTSVCRECTSKNRRDAQLRRIELKKQASDVANARNLKLNDFTPRELLSELKRRGYEFKVTYTETHVIDSNDIEI